MHYLLKVMEKEGFNISLVDKILDFGRDNGSLMQSFRLF